MSEQTPKEAKWLWQNPHPLCKCQLIPVEEVSL